LLRVPSDPGIFVRETPCLDRRAPGMGQTGGGNLAIDVRLQLQILPARIAVRIDWQCDVHLGDVDLHSQSREALDIGRNGCDIGAQVLDVHLKSNAIDRDSALPEISDHGVDRVRLRIHDFRPGLVVKKQSLRIGFMRPAETTLNVGTSVCSQADSGLVEPERAPQFSRTQLVEGLIDHIPREYLAPVMSDHGLNVFLENLSKLAGSVRSFRQPFWILLMSDQRVPANLHAVPGREIHNLVSLRKIERLALRMHYLPLEDVFRLQHIKFAREHRRICRLGKLSRPHRGSDQDSRSLRNLTQRMFPDAVDKSQAKGWYRQKKHKRSPFPVVAPSEF